MQGPVVAVADDGDQCAVALDVHVDVTVEVRDVEQTLQVVRRDVALLLQAGDDVLVGAGGGLGLDGGGGAFRH